MRVAIFLMAVAFSAISAPASAQIFAPWDSWGDRGYWRGSPPPRRTYRPPPSYWEDYEDEDYYGRRPQRPSRPLGPALLEGGPRPAIAPKAPPVVAFPSSHPAGLYNLRLRVELRHGVMRVARVLHDRRATVR